MRLRIRLFRRIPSVEHSIPIPLPAVQHRRDIEGLRAIAVLIVVAYHAGIPGWGGGFIGVDVFFVISGFLITSLLIKERESDGRIALLTFYARRIRRLLPISSVVAVVSVVGALAILPSTTFSSLGTDVVAAAGFFVNMLFAIRGTDYLAGDTDPSVIQHYWSLAVEEQFYLIWPGLIALVTIGAQQVRRRITPVIITVISGSFAASVVLSPTAPTWSYFGLHTRAFELGVGALLAVQWPLVERWGQSTRAALSWAGLIGIGFSIPLAAAVDYFPGWVAAIPVLATAAAIAGGDTTDRGAQLLLRRRPLQWVGEHSYSLYLWHWPVLVLGAGLVGRTLGWSETIAAIALTFALSALGFKLIEHPLRRSPRLIQQPAPNYSLGASLIGLTLLVGVGVSQYQPQASTGVVAEAPSLSTSTTTTVAADTTFAAPHSSASTNDSATSAPTSTTLPPLVDNRDAEPLAAILAALDNTVLPENVRPDVYNAVNDTSTLYDTNCHQFMTPAVTKGCVFGDTDGEFTIGLIGDSHAAQWFAAINTIAISNEWRLIAHTQGGCPLLDVVTWNRGADAVFSHCASWRDAVIDDLQQEGVDVVIVSQHWGLLDASTREAVPASVWERDLPTLFDRLRSVDIEPVLFLDSPDPYGSVPACAVSHKTDLTSCEPGMLRNTERSVREVATSIADEMSVGVIDPHVWLCVDVSPDDDSDTTRCPVVVGDILVYRDSHHLSNTFVEWFTPVISAELVDWITAQ
jgi:peptidoglycan/LPS O-acetylase OafA/YrhL